jgi:hypothetical protein
MLLLTLKVEAFGDSGILCQQFWQEAAHLSVMEDRRPCV